MLLRRVNDRYQRESVKFEPHEDGSAHVFFRNFGKGSVNTSDLVAIFDWADIEALTKTLAASGNPAAIRFEHAMNVASAFAFFSKNSD